MAYTQNSKRSAYVLVEYNSLTINYHISIRYLRILFSN